MSLGFQGSAAISFHLSGSLPPVSKVSFSVLKKTHHTTQGISIYIWWDALGHKIMERPLPRLTEATFFTGSSFSKCCAATEKPSCVSILNLVDRCTISFHWTGRWNRLMAYFIHTVYDFTLQCWYFPDIAVFSFLENVMPDRYAHGQDKRQWHGVFQIAHFCTKYFIFWVHKFRKVRSHWERCKRMVCYSCTQHPKIECAKMDISPPSTNVMLVMQRQNWVSVLANVSIH